jgi:hypothetical protein
MSNRFMCSLTILAACCAPAFAQRGLPDHGLDFVTVGAPGNSPIAVPISNGFGKLIDIGRVDRAFRITRTEVTRGQWLGFLDAYRPYVPVTDYNSSTFSGRAAQYAGVGSDGLPQYVVLAPELNNRPVTPSWEYAARFMNWLHNGARPIHQATFEDFNSGAYNMDAFGTDEATVRQQGARYFMPNYDEWTKAVYYDPDRYGEGQGGYWAYPNQSDDPLLQGVPGVGETSGGWGWASGGLDDPPPLGAYGVETPWGLLDASGGESEWNETFAMNHPDWNTHLLWRPTVGSRTSGNDNSTAFLDEIGYARGASPHISLHTFRIATFVPCADANGDEIVNFADLNAVLADFGQSGEGLAGDVNGDGVVDFVDLNEVLAAFGAPCE